MTTQAIQWYANRLKEQELGIKAGELTARQSELDESIRHNSEVERENQRHNLAYEEYQRQQLAEDYRHNMVVEAETQRSNQEQEEIGHEKNDVSTSNAWITAGGRVASGVIPKLLTAGAGALGTGAVKAAVGRIKLRTGNGQLQAANNVTSGSGSTNSSYGTGPRMSEDERWAQEFRAKRDAELNAKYNTARATEQGAKTFSDKVAAAGNSFVTGSLMQIIAGSILPLPMLRIISDKYGGVWADVVGSYQGYDTEPASERERRTRVSNSRVV